MTARMAVGVLAAALLGSARAPSAEPTLAETLCTGYARIESVSSRVRKTTEAGGRKTTLLSQVYYQRPDRMHVENIAPVRRRIIADGRRFFYRIGEMNAGFSCPLDRLDGEFKIMQQSVPASPMEHLLRLRGKPEDQLPAAPGYPVRRGYASENVYVVLSCDPAGRLARIEFFNGADRQRKTAQVEYSDFEDAGDGVWLAALHQGQVFLADQTVFETRRFDALAVNQPMAASLFVAEPFFPGVHWLDSMPALLKEAGAGAGR